MTIAAVVLAAGAGTRFAASGGRVPKPLAPLDGIAMVDRVLAVASAAGFDEVVLVDGSVDLSDRASEHVTVLHNPAWAEGIASSLHLALEHARTRGHGAVVVGLADQPGITAEAWRAVADSDGMPIAAATYDRRRANPVRLAREIWDLLPTTGDEGARALMQERPDLVREVPCSGDHSDVDTLEDLEQWS